MKRVVLGGDKRIEVIANTGTAFCWIHVSSTEGKLGYVALDRRGLRRLIEGLQEAERIVPKDASEITSCKGAIG